jgi:hypothetical protein
VGKVGTKNHWKEGELVNEEWQVAEVSTYKVYQGWAARPKNSEGVGEQWQEGELVNEEWQVAEVSTYKVYQGWAARPKNPERVGKTEKL